MRYTEKHMAKRRTNESEKGKEPDGELEKDFG